MQQTDSRPVISLMLGIMSIVLAMTSCGFGGCCLAWLPMMLGAIGFFLARGARQDIAEGLAAKDQDGMASAGYAASLVGLAVSTLIMAMYGILFLIYGGLVTGAAVFQNL